MKKSLVRDHLKLGFSLIEVMIVVVIIGILATLAYPRLERYLISSRQTEVKTNLIAIHTAQKIYHSSNRKYAASLNELGVEVPQGENAQYSYTLETDGNSFTVTATGNIDSDETKDVWTINQDKNLINVENDVTN